MSALYLSPSSLARAQRATRRPLQRLAQQQAAARLDTRRHEVKSADAAGIDLHSGTPVRLPLGRWAKDKVWSCRAETYI